MNGIVDFHSHILPGIDDGSASLRESIAMLKTEAAQGIQHVVATPHFYAQHDTLEAFLSRRNEAEERLREEMENHSGLPMLHMGAEIYLFPGMCHSDLLSGLAIDHKSCILIEMPGAPWTGGMYRELEDIQSLQGLTPIVAHVDRYIRPLRTHRIPQTLEQLPVLVQANASFFLRKQTRGMALKMIRSKKIHLLGSDCHNMTTRIPNLGDAVQVIRRNLGDDILEQIESYQDVALGDLETEIMTERSTDCDVL